jgi:hypothetical protein
MYCLTSKGNQRSFLLSIRFALEKAHVNFTHRRKEDIVEASGEPENTKDVLELLRFMNKGIRSVLQIIIAFFSWI